MLPTLHANQFSFNIHVISFFIFSLSLFTFCIQYSNQFIYPLHDVNSHRGYQDKIQNQ